MALAIISSALLLEVVTTTITCWLTAQAYPDQAVFGIACAATLLDAFTSLMLVLLLVRFLKGTLSRNTLLGFIPALPLYFAGTALTIIAMGFQIGSTTPETISWIGPCAAGLTFGCISVMSTIAAFIWVWLRPKDAERSTYGDVPVESTGRPAKRTVASGRTSKPGRPPRPQRPAPASTSSSATSSEKLSLSTDHLEVSSKTNLLVSASSQPNLSARTNEEKMVEQKARQEEFSDWTATSPFGALNPPPTRKGSSRSSSRPGSRPKLETIPGSPTTHSRPLSPTQVLDGPFVEEPSPTDLTSIGPPFLPVQTASVIDVIAPQQLLQSVIDGRPGTPEQALIHPLFRTESPGPKPLASPGTVITASPYAGQTVDPALAVILTRSPHSSAPSSPVLSAVRSRACSLGRAASTVSLPSPLSEEVFQFPPVPSLPAAHALEKAD